MKLVHALYILKITYTHASRIHIILLPFLILFYLSNSQWNLIKKSLFRAKTFCRIKIKRRWLLELSDGRLLNK